MQCSIHSRRHPDRPRATVRRRKNAQFSLKFSRNRFVATNERLCNKTRELDFARTNPEFLDAVLHPLPPPPRKAPGHGPPDKNTHTQCWLNFSRTLVFLSQRTHEIAIHLDNGISLLNKSRSCFSMQCCIHSRRYPERPRATVPQRKENNAQFVLSFSRNRVVTTNA